MWYAFLQDRRGDAKISRALFWPTLWYLVVATRPIGAWLQLWGIPLFRGDSIEEAGSPIDRIFFSALTLIGLWVLYRRGFKWGWAVKGTRWLTVLLVLMAVSILWSNYPFISFKRYIKVIGSVVMALVVLTEANPLESLLAVLRRCLYVHIPMSIICTRYFREIGVNFDWSGVVESWQGISTSKNTLGQVAMLGTLYFSYELRRRWKTDRWWNLSFLYLIMAVYLLRGSGESISLTSMSVTLLALVVFHSIQSLRGKPGAVRRFVLFSYGAISAVVLVVVTHSVMMFSQDSVFGRIIATLGRDITMTDRTYIWSDMYSAVDNPLIGVGYGGFWIGRIANIPWNANMTWYLGQGHSGYVDTYLQLGLVGWFLLTVILVSAVPRLLRVVHEDFDRGCLWITLFLVIMFVNITETTYLRGDHHLWFLQMVVLWEAGVSRAETSRDEPV